MKKLILASICSCFFLISNAQEEKMALSLDEAINFAIENSYNTKASKNDIKSATEKVWETTTIGLPQINGAIDYQNNLKQQVSLLPAEITGGPAGTFTPVIFGTKQNIGASITLKQLLFDGSYLVGLQASRTYLKISKQANEKTELLTREAVINAYGNVLVSENSISILEKNLKIIKKNLSDVKKIYENGLNEQEDIEQLEITLGNLNSQLNSVKRMKSIAYKMLNLSIGNPIETELTLTDTLDSLVKNNISLDIVSEEFSISNHVDFKIAENDRESKRLLLKLEKSKALPTLSAFVNYGTQGYSETFSFLKNEQEWFKSSLLGVSLNIPIFSSLGRSSKTKQATIALENADIKLKETKQRLSLMAEKARNDYQLSIENYSTTKKNVGLAERIENKQRIKFFEGLSSSFDLLQAQNQLYSQQQNYIQSMLDVIAKKATLENALNIPIK
ncbi:TolC family protein [uncultured Polaribacter sp.]|uniref:TolC family protein n=1 Tax=uncultured Polaribacter sp. TaxID=174711 RepID=UPI00263376CC|nr:TolC family protein [uncultured Polaribacter sp.]